MNKIVIPLDQLPSLNQHDNANRGNRFGGASMKKKATNHCSIFIKKAINQGFELKTKPSDFTFTWYAKDRRTDKDNLAFAKKYIFDAMVNVNLIENDGWKQIGNWKDVFEVDKENPRVEIKENAK